MAEDEELLHDWWLSVAEEKQEGAGAGAVVALWFGLVELLRGDRSRWGMYAVGCGSFDPVDRAGDWRTEICWIPEGRYLFLPGLDARRERPYRDMLIHAANLIERAEPQESWFPPLRGVAVGFDDGDFVITFAA